MASSSGNGTISSMLDCLNLIRTSEASPAPLSIDPFAFNGNSRQQQAQTSAAQQLLEHRAHEKERRVLAANLPLPQKPAVRSNPLLDQIAASNTAPPTYWKYANSNKPGGGSKKVHKSSTAANFVSKAVMKKRSKGEAYADKLQEKGSKHVRKTALKQHIKRS